MSDILSTHEAADLIDVDVRTVQKMINDGRLPAKLIGRTWVITRRNALAAKRKIGSPGRPKKNPEKIPEST